jgi:hypothetical protein
MDASKLNQETGGTPPITLLPFHTLRLDKQQVSTSLNRLVTRKNVHQAGTRFCLSAETAAAIGGQSSAIEGATDAMVSDILQRVVELNGSSLTDVTIRLANRNIRAAMLTLFRFYGIDLASQYDKSGTLAVSPEPGVEVFTTLGRQLDPKTTTALGNVLADMLAKPTDEQAKVISHWCRAYLGLRIMNADPTAVEFQKTRLKSKMFVLDTDFLLDCIVAELPSSDSDLALVKKLLAADCRVIVPLSAIKEAVVHADISSRTYKYFGMAGSNSVRLTSKSEFRTPS